MKYEHVKKEHDAEVNHICRTADIVAEVQKKSKSWPGMHGQSMYWPSGQNRQDHGV
jgi:hypothetical protein